MSIAVISMACENLRPIDVWDDFCEVPLLGSRSCRSLAKRVKWSHNEFRFRETSSVVAKLVEG